MVLLEVRTGVLVLVLHGEELGALLPLEALAHQLVLLGEAEVRHQQVESLLEVLLGGRRVASVVVQIGVWRLERALAPLHFVVQLALAVLDKAVGRQAVGVKATRQILSPNLLSGSVVVLRKHGQLVVEWSRRIGVLEVETRPSAVVERRRLGGVLMVVVARGLRVVELVVDRESLRLRVGLRKLLVLTELRVLAPPFPLRMGILEVLAGCLVELSALVFVVRLRQQFFGGVGTSISLGLTALFRVRNGSAVRRSIDFTNIPEMGTSD